MEQRERVQARLRPLPLPFLKRSSDRSSRRDFEGSRFHSLVRCLLDEVFSSIDAGDSDNDGDDDVSPAITNVRVQSSDVYFLLKSVLPVLLGGLAELAGIWEIVVARRTTQDMKPLDFLGSFLMRHNASGASALASEGLGARRRRREQRDHGEEAMEVLRSFMAERQVRGQMEHRQKLWRGDNGEALMGLWRLHCPHDDDGMTLAQVRESLGKFQQALGMPNLTAEALFDMLLNGDTGSSLVVQFADFEEVLARMLPRTRCARLLARPSCLAQRKVSLWVKGKALETLEKRLCDHRVDSRAWFAKYANPPGGAAMPTADMLLCAKHLAKSFRLNIGEPEVEALVRYSPDASLRELSLRTLGVDIASAAAAETGFVDYETFVRQVAEMLRVSGERNAARLQKRAQKLMDAKTAESVKRVHAYLREIDRVETKLTKATKVAEGFRDTFSRFSEAVNGPDSAKTTTAAPSTSTTTPTSTTLATATGQTPNQEREPEDSEKAHGKGGGEEGKVQQVPSQPDQLGQHRRLRVTRKGQIQQLQEPSTGTGNGRARQYTRVPPSPKNAAAAKEIKAGISIIGEKLEVLSTQHTDLKLDIKRARRLTMVSHGLEASAELDTLIASARSKIQETTRGTEELQSMFDRIGNLFECRTPTARAKRAPRPNLAPSPKLEARDRSDLALRRQLQPIESEGADIARALDDGEPCEGEEEDKDKDKDKDKDEDEDTSESPLLARQRSRSRSNSKLRGKASKRRLKPVVKGDVSQAAKAGDAAALAAALESVRADSSASFSSSSSSSSSLSSSFSSTSISASSARAKTAPKGTASSESSNGNAEPGAGAKAEADEDEDAQARRKRVNEKDKNGSTPLMHVAWPGNIECARILLQHGANPNLTNLRLNTALHFAVERGHLELAKLMVAHNGVVALGMRNALGKTPVDLNPSMRKALLSAARKNSTSKLH